MAKASARGKRRASLVHKRDYSDDRNDDAGNPCEASQVERAARHIEAGDVPHVELRHGRLPSRCSGSIDMFPHRALRRQSSGPGSRRRDPLHRPSRGKRAELHLDADRRDRNRGRRPYPPQPELPIHRCGSNLGRCRRCRHPGLPRGRRPAGDPGPDQRDLRQPPDPLSVRGAPVRIPALGGLRTGASAPRAARPGPGIEKFHIRVDDSARVRRSGARGPEQSSIHRDAPRTGKSVERLRPHAKPNTAATPA